MICIIESSKLTTFFTLKLTLFWSKICIFLWLASSYSNHFYFRKTFCIQRLYVYFFPIHINKRNRVVARFHVVNFVINFCAWRANNNERRSLALGLYALD